MWVPRHGMLYPVLVQQSTALQSKGKVGGADCQATESCLSAT